jgi:hypothetical protein
MFVVFPIRAGLCQSNKLRTYGVIKTKSTFSCYLKGTVSFKYRKAIASLRLSVHPLMVEVGRYSAHRYCPACPVDVESECHFLLHCPSYKVGERTSLLLQELYTCEGRCLNITTHGEQYCFLKLLDPSAETAPCICIVYTCTMQCKSGSPCRLPDLLILVRYSFNMPYLFICLCQLYMYLFCAYILMFCKINLSYLIWSYEPAADTKDLTILRHECVNMGISSNISAWRFPRSAGYLWLLLFLYCREWVCLHTELKMAAKSR